MFDLSPITGIWHSRLRSKVFPAKKTADTIEFKSMERGIAAYRWLIPPFDAALLLLSIQSLGPVDPETGRRAMDTTFLVLAFAAISLLRLGFLFLSLRHWFDVAIRNLTNHKLLRRSIKLPIDPKNDDRIDKSRPLTIDGTSYPAEAVRGVEITGIAFAHASAWLDPNPDFPFRRDLSKAATAMVGDRQRIPLDEKGKDLPPPWATDDPALAPIYSPTLVLRECAYQLFSTRDLYQALDFTRGLRHAFSLRGPLRVLGLLPFQSKQNRTTQGVFYPVLGLFLLLASFVSGAVWLRASSPSLSLLSMPAFYLAQEGLMLLCRISVRSAAAERSTDNVAWLNSNIADPG